MISAADHPSLLDPPAHAAPRRLAPWACGAVALGYLAARHAPDLPPAPLFAGAAAALLLALFARAWLCRAALFLALIAAGAGWFTLQIHHRPAHSLAWHINTDPLAEPAVMRVRGLIVSRPELRDHLPRPWPLSPRPRSVAAELRLDAVELNGAWSPARGRLLIRIETPFEHLPPFMEAGSRIVATGRILPVRAPVNPGDPPRHLLAAQHGTVGTLIIPSTDLLAPDQPARFTDRLLAAAFNLRAKLQAAAEAPLRDSDAESAPANALVRAMLLGERDPALEPVESAFRRVGLVHLVAISGFNLAALVWITLVAVRITGDRGRLEALIGAAALIGYLIILPGEASIQRAGFTLLVFMLSESFGRRYDRINLLFWCALFLLILRPMDLWSLGFQLSFGIVAALLTLGRRVHQRLWGLEIRGLSPTPRQRIWWYAVASGLLSVIKAQITATILAWAVAAPIIAHHTGLFSPLAPIASLIVLPVTIVLLIAGYIVMLLGLVIPPAAELVGSILSLIGEFTVLIVRHLDEWPGAAIHLPRLSPAWTLAATVTLVYALGWARLRAWWPWTAAALIAAWTALAFAQASRLPRDHAWQLDALAMPDGEALLIRTGQPHHALLINCGAGGDRPSADDLTRTVRELGGYRVPTVLITSPDVRAWSRLPALIRPLAIRTVLLPQSLINAATLEPSGTHARLLHVLREHQLNLRIVGPGDRFTLGPAECELVVTTDPAARELVPRFTLATRGGPRSVLLASAISFSQLAESADTEHADLLLLPRTLRQSDKPGELIADLSPSASIFNGATADARLLLDRLGPRGPAPFINAHGAVSTIITPDGRIHTTQFNPRHP